MLLSLLPYQSSDSAIQMTNQKTYPQERMLRHLFSCSLLSVAAGQTLLHAQAVPSASNELQLNNKQAVKVARLIHKQGREEKLIPRLEELVVTGTRTAHKFIDAPIKVDVISKQELKQLHASELQEGLKTIPGVQIKPVTGKEGSEAWIQGISANRILVLIDGEPISPTTGSSVDLSQISISGVERIEVVKGATSVLYGSQAIGGVINVITSTPEPGFHGRVSSDVGSYGERNPSGNASDITRQRTAASISYAAEKYYVKGDVSLRFSDGYQTNPSSETQEGPDGHRNNASFTLGLTPDESSEYSLRYEVYDQELGTSFEEPAPINATTFRRDDATRNRLSAKAQWSFGQNEVQLQAFQEDYKTESQPDNSTFRETHMPLSQANIQLSSVLNESHSTTIGAQVNSESLSSKKNGENELLDPKFPGKEIQSRESLENFIQDEWTLGLLTLVPGIRLQNDSDFGSHTSPKLNFRLDTSDWFFIRGGIGEGYRSPNLKERYYLLDHSNFNYKVIGNSELVPEQSTSYQLAFVVTDGQRFQAEINFYKNDLTDLIEAEYSHNEGNINIYQYQNLDGAYTQGYELSGQFTFNNKLNIKGGYTHLQSGNETTGLDLNNRPQHQIKTSFNYQTDWKMNISVIANWQSDAIEKQNQRIEESAAWEQIDLKFTQTLYKHQVSTLNFYGGIENITDQYRDFTAAFDNRPTIGRLAYLGLSYDF